APLLDALLARVALRGVAREARRDDQRRPRAQQLDPGLVADLHAAAREQRDATAQVGGLAALRVVEVAALEAHLVVEVMQRRVLLLAHVAVLAHDRLALLRLRLGRR